MSDTTEIHADDAALAAVTDPIERARLICLIATERRTLSPSLAKLYRASLREARGDGERKLSWIARRVGISPGRVSQLTKTTTPEGAAA